MMRGWWGRQSVVGSGTGAKWTGWVAVLVLAACTRGQTEAQERVFGEVAWEGSSFPYAVHLPGTYVEGRGYPVLLGPGAATPSSDPSFFWPGGSEDSEWVIVESMAWLEGNDPIGRTRALIAELRDRYQPEGGKFHLLGYSASSGPAFSVALAIPDEFHSITGLPGHPNARGEGLDRLRDVRVQIIVGENDGYWLRAAQDAETRMSERGIDVSLEIYPDGGHALAVLKGKPFLDRMERLRVP